MDTFTQAVQNALISAGWHVSVKTQRLQATREDIKARWWFGSRKVTLSLDCVLDFSDKVLTYREIAKEVSRGIPPPTLSLSTFKQSGTHVKIARQDYSLAGGGVMHYGSVRKLLEHICQQSGWQLRERLII